MLFSTVIDSHIGRVEIGRLLPGPHCVVKEPAELARQVKSLAAAIVNQYDTKPASKNRKKASPQ